MIFTIKQGSTLPKLKLQLYSGNTHSKVNFIECIKNANITFSMWDKSCGKKVISCKEVTLEKITDGCAECTSEDYLLVVNWNYFDTMDKGHFKGEITVELLDGSQDTMILPQGEDLDIIIN